MYFFQYHKLYLENRILVEFLSTNVKQNDLGNKSKGREILLIKRRNFLVFIGTFSVKYI